MRQEPTRLAEAALAAGPLVGLLLGLGSYVSSVPQTLEVTPESIGVGLFFLLAAMGVGFIPALAAAAIGQEILDRLAARWPVARDPLAWCLIGALLGGGLPLALRADALFLFAFAGAGALCGLIARPRKGLLSDTRSQR